LDCIYTNGDTEKRLPHNLNISFAYVESESLLMAVNESIAVSSGSACTDGSADTSHVLKALRVVPERLHTALRFGVGRFNTAEEIDFVIQKVTETVRKLRAMSPLYEARPSRQGRDGAADISSKG
jgi:cysteine desulfurase